MSLSLYLSGSKKRKAPADADGDLEQLGLDDKELRLALKEVGVEAGPIDSSNRFAVLFSARADVYLKQLMSLLSLSQLQK